MICYLDTSVFIKTLTRERESESVLTALAQLEQSDATFASSALLITETLRAGRRLGISLADTESALQLIELVDVTEEVLRAAGALTGSTLRPLDAIHVATAIDIEADVLVTADTRQAAAARDAGLDVVDRFV